MLLLLSRIGCASAEVTGPLLFPGIVLFVGVLQLEPRVREGGAVTCAPFLASRLPGCSLWRTPVNIVTRTCASSDSPALWFLPQVSFFLFHVYALFEVLGLYYVHFIKTLTP
jgi:hypothetical protein